MQQGLYHNKVNLSLTPAKRLGNQARNCEMDCSEKTHQPLTPRN